MSLRRTIEKTWREQQSPFAIGASDRLQHARLLSRPSASAIGGLDNYRSGRFDRLFTLHCRHHFKRPIERHVFCCCCRCRRRLAAVAVVRRCRRRCRWHTRSRARPNAAIIDGAKATPGGLQTSIFGLITSACALQQSRNRVQTTTTTSITIRRRANCDWIRSTSSRVFSIFVLQTRRPLAVDYFALSASPPLRISA